MYQIHPENPKTGFSRKFYLTNINWIVKKTDFVRFLAKKTGSRIVDENKNLNDVLEAIKDVLAEEDALVLLGFGTFRVKIQKGRRIRTVHGNIFDVPDQRVARFWVGDKLKRKVSGKKATPLVGSEDG